MIAALPARDGNSRRLPRGGRENPDLTVERRRPCADGSAAEFVTIAGGPDAWPGGTPRVQPRTGAGCADYDATAEVVSFLLSHPRPA
jgi:poly(3-hydroxybutyrate) depolymerase